MAGGANVACETRRASLRRTLTAFALPAGLNCPGYQSGAPPMHSLGSSARLLQTLGCSCGRTSLLIHRNRDLRKQQ